ncbi:acyl-CoA thioesterase [Desulfoluna butyratoxydans]|uniref:Hotdog domain n=1 Tax=Desulfoluna butyratoxydans TaxID=231438 RepID=A0A4U8YQH5_9BACT|nr:acyl-CoA thioesterase [Desulfoluna butyratoxydans]VFQ44002.1 hotdog domain [Desulfoluna butyratoxydans]
MDTYAIVRPEHLNHHGYLFGGALLKWIDEYAWLVASRDFPGCTLVTIGMDDIVFKQRVISGAILRFQIEPVKKGGSSVRYGVEVFSDEPGATNERHVFSTTITFVRLDEQGKKCDLPAEVRYRSLAGGTLTA